MSINPLALLWIALCTAVGYAFGSWLTGLIVGLIIVLIASVSSR